MSSPDERLDVAIACQGGGSHTAFTAGVLEVLLDDFPAECNLVGLSGTSGGAACASLAWYGLVASETIPGKLLEGFWNDLAAHSPLHRSINTVVRWGIELQRAGIPLPDVSPAHSPGAKWGEREFRKVIESHIDFEAVSDLCDGSEPALFLLSLIHI